MYKNPSRLIGIFSFIFLIFITLAAITVVARIIVDLSYIFLFVSIFIAVLFAFLLCRTQRFSVLHPVWSCVIVLFAAAIPRIVFTYLIKTVPSGDFFTYNQIANALANGTMLTDPNTPLRYASIFPHVVAYPSFLSIFIRLGLDSIFWSQALSIVCYSISALLTGTIADRINKGNFLSGGLIFALFPSQIYYSALMATESLFILLMLISVAMFMRFIHKSQIQGNSIQKTILLIFFPVVLALANAVRPIGLVLLIASLLFLLLCGFLHVEHTAVKRIVSLVTIIIIYFASSHFLSFGESRIIGREISASPVGFNLYVGMNRNNTGKWNESDSKEFLELSRNRSLSPQQIQDKFLGMGISRAMESPSALPGLAINKFRVMWSGDAESVSYIERAINPKTSILALNKSDILKYIADLYYFIILLFVLFRTAMLQRKRTFYELYPMLIIMGIAAVHLIVEVAGRYHAPALPLLAILAFPCTETFIKRIH